MITEVTCQPGPGTQAKLSIDPSPLWFWTSNRYVPGFDRQQATC